MRKIAFVAFGIDNAVVDRLSLDLITEVQNVGYKLKLSTIDTDLEDIITKVVQEKQEVKFKLNFVNQAYEKSGIVSQWLEKYSTATARMGIEYNDGARVRHCEGKVTGLTKTEKDEFNRLVREVTFRPVSPFFTSIENTIKIKVAASGKSYPFRYPYAYGKNVVENNEIDNTYILPVPITVKISGTIYEPTILLLDENNAEYGRVKFTGVTLSEGQHIIINSADRKIWFFNGSVYTDCAAETDPNYDSFLQAAPNSKSKISVNFEPTDTGELTGSWRQYGL